MGLTHIKACLLDEESQAIRLIRDRVFAQEQGIDPSLDWDGKDTQSVHLLAFAEQTPVAVLRLREIDNAAQVKLERLAVLADFRCQGIGSELVYTAIAYAKEQGYSSIAIDLRAHGRSEGEYCTYGYYEKEDIAQIISDYLRYNPDAKIGIWGAMCW